MPSDQSQTAQPFKFFALAFALALPLYAISQLLGNRMPGGLPLPISALGALLPAVAAGILTYRQQGRAGVRQLFWRTFDYDRIRAKRWLVPLVLINPLVMLGSYFVMRLAGLPLPEPQIQWLAAPLLFGVFFIFGAGEELGWQGYAYEPLERRWGTWKAALLLGLVWVAFHFIPDLQNRQPLGWIAWHRLGTVLNRLLIVWFYRKTGRSVFAAILYHDLLNVSWILFPNNGSHYNPMITTLLTALAAAGLFFVKPKPAAHKRPAKLVG